mmetsp:Transcript_86430/g.259295  ORF Transcript_86430/g.259295 Transcript_86430/m.259295 type:complete len:219 (+) Transcript_86430:772-1428(+)
MDVCNLCSQLHFRNNDCVSHRGSVPQVRFVKWRLFTGGNPCVHLCRCVVHRSASALAVQFIPVSNCNIARADDASRSINLLSSQGVQKPILLVGVRLSPATHLCHWVCPVDPAHDALCSNALWHARFLCLPDVPLPGKALQTRRRQHHCLGRSIGHHSHIGHGAMHPALHLSARGRPQAGHPYSGLPVHGKPGHDRDHHQLGPPSHLCGPHRLPRHVS